MLSCGGCKQVGLSLVELMVGMVVGLLVIAAAIGIYAVVVRSGNEILGSAKLNQELRAAMDLMVADIRRAGSWSPSAALESHPPTNCEFEGNPFTVRGTGCTNTDLQINGSAILFTYNRLPDWEYGVLIGFRLSGGAIEMRQCNNTAAAPGVCDTTTIGTGWEALTDVNTVTLDALSFDTSGSRCLNATTGVTSTPPCSPPSPNQRWIEKRQILITIRGHLTTRPEYTMTLRQAVWVANDRIILG